MLHYNNHHYYPNRNKGIDLFVAPLTRFLAIARKYTYRKSLSSTLTCCIPLPLLMANTFWNWQAYRFLYRSLTSLATITNFLISPTFSDRILLRFGLLSAYIVLITDNFQRSNYLSQREFTRIFLFPGSRSSAKSVRFRYFGVERGKQQRARIAKELQIFKFPRDFQLYNPRRTFGTRGADENVRVVECAREEEMPWFDR